MKEIRNLSKDEIQQISGGGAVTAAVGAGACVLGAQRGAGIGAAGGIWGVAAGALLGCAAATAAAAALK